MIRQAVREGTKPPFPSWVAMTVKMPLQRTFRVHRRADGRFESRNEHPKEAR